MASVTSRLKAGLLGGVVAAIVNLVIFYISRYAFGIQYIVPQGPQRGMAPISPWAVVIFSIVPGLLATLLLLVLVKITPLHARKVFLSISLIVLVGSFALPIMAAEYVSEQTLLNIMHVIAATCIVSALLKTVPVSPSRSTE